MQRYIPMGMTQLAAINAALSLVFRSSMVSQINSVAVLPYLLPITTGAGKSLNYTVEFTGASNATATAEGVALSSSDADAENEIAANLSWAQYSKVSSVSDLAEAAAASNFNPESIGALRNDLLLGRAVKQCRRLGLGVAANLYNGNETASPVQLAGAARAIDSSGTFAGIDPGTYTEWASVEQTGALSAASFSIVRAWLTAIYDASGELPEFVTCGSTVWNALRDLYTDYEAHTIRAIQTGRGGGMDGLAPRETTLKAGMRAFEIDDVPFVLDKFATASTMYAWNTNYVSIEQLDPVASILAQGEAAINAVFAQVSGQSGIQLPRAEIEGMQAVHAGLRPSIKLLGNRGLSREASVYLFAQVKWESRNRFGKYTWS